MLKIKNVVLFLSIVGAALVVFNADSISKLSWRIRYGHRQAWSGIDIQLTANEYFMPISDEGGTLFIRDDDSTALIFLQMRNFTADEMRLYANEDCKILGCSKVDERQMNIGQVKVLSLSYSVGPLGAPILQKHLLVEGSGVWVQYTGPLGGYKNSKETLERIIDVLAKKVAKSEVLSARR